MNSAPYELQFALCYLLVFFSIYGLGGFIYYFMIAFTVRVQEKSFNYSEITFRLLSFSLIATASAEFYLPGFTTWNTDDAQIVETGIVLLVLILTICSWLHRISFIGVLNELHLEKHPINEKTRHI